MGPQRDWSTAPTEVDDDDTTTPTPVVETPSGGKDASKVDCLVEEMDRQYASTGLDPPQGGDVFIGEVKMSPSPDDEVKAIEDQLMRGCVEAKEEIDSEEDCEEFVDVPNF